MRNAALTASAALLLLTQTGQADAATWLVTYSGFLEGSLVSDGGVLVSAGELEGDAFEATFEVDDVLGTRIDQVGFSRVEGLRSNFRSGDIELSLGRDLVGYDQKYSRDARGVVSNGTGVILSEAFHVSDQGSPNFRILALDLRAEFVGLPFSITDMGANFVGMPARGTGIVQTGTIDISQDQEGLEQFSFRPGFFYSRLNVTQVSIGPLSTAVPEPGVWIMLIGGFAVMGAVLRSRQRAEHLRRHAPT